MIYDDLRNAAYAAALEQHVNADSVVLDLGAGLGIHGLMAAFRGARHVYLVDPSPVQTIAAKVAAANGLLDKVTFIRKKIEEAELPEPVDIIVSVFTGNFLLEEDLLPSLLLARDRFLKPSGVLLPDRAEMLAVPVCAAEYYRRHVGQWSLPSQGIDFSAVRPYAANSLCYDSAKNREARFLAQPLVLASLDFGSAAKTECSSEVVFETSDPGECHGFVGWFRMWLGENWLSTSPQDPALHWSQVFLPVDPPIQLAPGDAVSFRLHRPEYGEWTWICAHKGVTQRHSTFFSRMLSTDGIRHLARDHPVQASATGELARFVIDRMDGVNTVESIHRLATQAFRGRFSTARELERNIQSILASCGK